MKRALVLVAGLLVAVAAHAGPVGPVPLNPDQVILNQGSAQSGKTFDVPGATITALTSNTIKAQSVTINGVAVSTQPFPASYTVYPATSAITTPGITSTFGTFTGIINGTSVTITGLFSGATIHGSSAVITGTITGSNLSGTNRGDVTIGTGSGLTITGQVLSMATSNTTSTGSLTATAYNTFNNKISPTGNGSGLTGLTKTQVGLSNVQDVDQTDAGNLASGTVDTARLGTGSATSSTFLRGDQTYAAVTSTNVGLGQVTNAAQVKKTDYTQKGGFLVGTGTGGVYANQAPGPNGTVPIYDSSAPTGISYVISPQAFTVYPATGRPSFPHGLDASDAHVTGVITGSTVTLSGMITANNLFNTNTGDVTIDVANGLTLNQQALSLALASASQNGSLSSTDWSRFDAKTSTTGATLTSVTIVGGTASNFIVTSGTVTLSSATVNGPINARTGSFSSTLTSSNLSGTNTGDLTLGTTNGLSITSQVLSMGTASTSNAGALSATDWTTFNNKTSTINATMQNVTITSGTIVNFTLTGGTITPTAITGSIVDFSSRTVSGTTTLSNAHVAGTLTDASTTTHSGSHTFTGIVAFSSASVSTMTVTKSIQWPDGYVEKVRPAFVNVKDYGAVGDGTTDDSAAATAACSAVASGPTLGGIVYFPNGKYKLNWVIGNNKCSVLGEENGTWFVQVSSTLPMISYYGTGPGGNITRRYVKGVTFQGTGLGRAVYINCPGFISFQNCRFSDLEYGVYKNSAEWIMYHDCSFSACIYGAFSTTINGDIFGNNPTFTINSGEDYFVQTMFVSNTLAYYTDNPNITSSDPTHASSFVSCVFHSNGLGLGAGDIGQSTYQTMLVSQGYFEDNGTGGGTINANGHAMNYGNIDFRGGALALDHMMSATGAGGIRISGPSYVRGTDIRLNSCPIIMSTDTASYFVMDGLISDANGGSGFNIEVPEALAPYTGNRAVLAIAPQRTGFVTSLGARNVIDQTSTCMVGTLPSTYSGSPTKSFMFGDGYYGNTCLKVSGATNAGVDWTATVSTSNYYVTTFAVRQDTGTSGNMLLQLNNASSLVTPNPQLQLSSQWKTYGIVGQTNSGGTTTLAMVLLQSGTFYVSCVQMVGFPTLAEAVAFYDSRTFILKPDEVSNRQYQASAAPTSGTWVVGDLTWNTAPSTGTNTGWVCITAGTPGTWLPFGNVTTTAAIPAFSVDNSTGPLNLTGDGTATIVPWPTVITNVGSNFANNTFTAPVTGKYYLSACAALINISTTIANATRIVQIVTTARKYSSLNAVSGPNTANNWSGCQSALADMTAGDTAVVKVYADTQSKTVGLYPGADYNYFTGYLVSSP